MKHNAQYDDSMQRGIDTRRIVRPVRQRLGAQLALLWLARGVAAALLAAAALTAAAHFIPWPDGDPLGGAQRWSVPLALLILAGAAAVVALRWPSVELAVRQADRALALKDRLTTAHEFAGREGELLRLQRAELREKLQQVNLRQAVRLRVPRWEALVAVVAALLLTGAALAPNPQATARAARDQQRAVAQHAARQAAASLTRIEHTLPRTPADQRRVAATNPNARQIASILKRLQAQLLKARNPAEALKALAAAQQQLRQLNAQGTRAQQALAALARALAGGQTQALSQALASGDPGATQQAMKALEQRLSQLSQGQRQNLAQKLQRAANAAQGSLADQLRQAARALADDNPAAARQALQQATQQLSQSQNAAAGAQAAQQAQQDVSKIKQDVANGVTQDSQQRASGAQNAANGRQQQGSKGQAGSQGQRGSQQRATQSQAGSQGQQSSQSAQGQQGSQGTQSQSGTQGSQSQAGNQGQQGSQGASASQQAGNQGNQGQAGNQGTQAGSNGSRAGGGQGARASRGQGSGAGQRGNGAGNGRALGRGSGQGQGAGSQGHGAGGHGSGGGRGGAGGTDSGKYEQVQLPGQRNGNGPSTFSNGPLGASVPVQSPAFRALLPRYSNAAESSLGRTALPPGLQAAVKQYFQALEQN